MIRAGTKRPSSNSGNTPEPGRMSLVAPLLSVLAGLLLVQQYVTMPKFTALPSSLSYLSLRRYVAAVSSAIEFDAVDVMLLACIMLACLALVGIEIRSRGLTMFLRGVFAGETATVLLLIACSVVFLRYYLGPGPLNWAGDSPQHIAYTEITGIALRSGEFPIWTNYLGAGSAYLQFYGFVFFLIAGAATALLQDVELALKLVLFVTHVLSGVGVYALGRAGGCRRDAAFVSGLAYVLCFWHMQQVLIMGRFPVALIYSLLPWPFWGLERAIRMQRLGPALVGGVTLGMLVLTHPGYGYWACALFATYAFVRTLPLSREGCRQRLVYAVYVLGTGTIIGAALVLPMWLERGFTGLNDGYSLAGIPGPEWWHVLVWSNYRFWMWSPAQAEFHWYGGYLGLSLIVSAAIAVVTLKTSCSHRHPTMAAAFVLLVASLLSFGQHHLWTWLVPYSDLLAPGRYLLFVSFFLSILAGQGLRALQVRQRQRQRHLATWVLLLIVIDLGPTTFQHVYSATQTTVDTAGVPLSMYEDLRASALSFEERGQLPDTRALWSPGPLHRFLATGFLFHESRMPTPDGPHPGELRAVFDFVRPLLRLMEATVAPEGQPLKTIDSRVGDALSLLNVSTLLVFRGQGKEVIRVKNTQATPAAVAPTLSPIPAGRASLIDLDHESLSRLSKGASAGDLAKVATLIKVLDDMQFDSATGQARTFHVSSLDQVLELGTSPSLVILQHEVRNQSVSMTLEVSQAAFVRLAYSYHPHLHVRVDGRQETSPRVTATGFLLLELTAGVHDIILEPRLSPLRTALSSLAIVVSLLALSVYILRR